MAVGTVGGEDGAVTRPAELLRVLLIVVAVIDLAAIVGVFVMPDVSPLGPAFAALGLLIVAVCEVLRRRGRVRLASYLIVSLLWILASVAVLSTGGDAAELSGIYAVLIVSAGLLTGRRAALGFGALFALTLLGVLLANLAGLSLWLTDVHLDRSAWGSWILGEISVALATVTIVYATRLVDRANAQMRYVAELTEHVGDAVISTDEAFRVRTWNRAAERMYGWTAEEVLGKSVAELIPPTYEKGGREEAIAALQAHGQWSGEVVQHHRDGHAIDIASSVTSILDADGRSTGTVAVNRDITKRKAVERALREETLLNQAILESLPGMFFMFDRRGKLVRWNNERLRFLGYEDEEMSRLDVADNIAPEDRAGVARVIEQVWAEGFGASEHRVITKDGQRIPVSARGRRVTISGEDYVVGMSFDIRDRVQMEAALRAGEARWRSYIEQATDFIISLDAEGRFTSINPAGCIALGYTEEELLGRSPLEIVASKDRDLAARILGRMLQGKEAESQELDVLTRAGERLTLEITGRPFVSEGRVEGTFHIARDITRRRAMEGQVRISERRYRTLIEQSPFSVVVYDADGRMILANQAAGTLWQLSDEQVAFLLEHYNVLQDEELEVQGIAPFIRRAYEGEAVTIPALRLKPRSPDGKPVGERTQHVRGFAYPVKDDEGRVREVVILHEDITERWHAEEVLRHAEKLESLGLISGGLAHDFNNLLTAVLGHASLARDKLDASHGAREHLQRIVSAAERASTLTEQLLAYSGRGRFHVQPVDLNLLIEEHLPLIEVAVPASVRLETELAAGLPAVEADEAQLQQLVMNLVINACEAAAEGQNWVRVVTERIHLAEGLPADHSRAGQALPPGDYLRLSVSDGGGGIGEEARARIFDPFFSTKKDGHGLGLAAVLGIVRGHAGGLHVESVLGEGTTFDVLLPVSSLLPERVEILPREPLRSASLGVVLVIDDEAPVREVVAAILDDEGIPVLTAEDGEAGLEVLKRHRDQVRMVLLDLTMPGISGEETCRRIRALAPDVSVVATSGYSDLELDERLSALGVVDFLKKPYPYDRLIALVREHLVGDAEGGGR